LNDQAELLQRLQPSTAALDRDRLMFEAGRQAAGISPAVHRPDWFWPLATAVSSLLALGLGLILLLQPTLREQALPEQQQKHLPSPEAEPAGQPEWPESPYHRLQEQLSHWGPDSMPAPAPAAPARQPATLEGLLRELDLWNTSLPSAKENH
jgi:hypothetical protein